MQAVRERYRGTNMPDGQLFQVAPEGMAGADFSFLVIGDPGEGDASQHVLRDQLIELGPALEVRVPGSCLRRHLPGGSHEGL